ncbi:unnamed protein product, partial [marine sediment metagenome]
QAFARRAVALEGLGNPVITQVAKRAGEAMRLVEDKAKKNGLRIIGEESGVHVAMLPFAQERIKDQLRTASMRVFFGSARQELAASAAAGFAGSQFLGGLGWFVGFRALPIVASRLATALAGRTPSAGLVSLVKTTGRGLKLGALTVSGTLRDELTEGVENFDPEDTYGSATQAYLEAGYALEDAESAAGYHAARLQVIKEALDQPDGEFARTLEAAVDPMTIIERIDSDETTSQDIKVLKAVAPAVGRRLAVEASAILA